MQTHLKTLKSKINLLTICFIVSTCLLALTVLSGCAPDNHTNSNKIDFKTDLSKLELIDKDTLTVAIASDYPPFESFKSVEPTGLDIDISYQLKTDLDKDLDFKNMDFDQVIDAVVQKKTDIAISGIAITEERAQKVDFSIPYYEDTKCIVVKKDSGITDGNIDESLKDNSKTLVCQSGSASLSYANTNYPNIKKIDKDTNEQCLDALKNGEANMFLVEKSYYENKLTNDYQIVKTIDSTEKYAIAISKDCPNLKAAINKILEARLADGTIQNMIEKNFK